MVTYKQDWSVFVPTFKKQFSVQKKTSYDQVDAGTLVKKEYEIVHHFALEVPQPFEKRWCNENASSKNPNFNEIFTKGLPKNY